MSIIVQGRLLQLVFLLGYSAAVFYGIYRSTTQKKVPQVRQPPAIMAIEEAMGRCVEMGRPMLFQTGIGDISDQGATHMAMLGVLAYTARMAAQKDANFIVTTPSPTLYPMAEGIVKDEYEAEGKADRFNSEMVQFLSNNQMAYASAVLHLMQRENIGANIQIGFFQAENLITLEAAKDVGAINIGGAVRTLRIPGMAIGCDYFLMGEEVFAAGAFCRRDATQLGALLGQDIDKAIAFILILIGVVFSIFGSNLLVQILNM
jgi:hypothetical protein